MSSKADKLAAAMRENTAQHQAAMDKNYAGSKTVGEKVENIPVEAIRPGKYQPRKRFNAQSLQGLVASVQENSIIQPIRVRPFPGQPGIYELVAGERRWRAAKAANKTHILAVVQVLNDEQTARFALSENLDREDLTDFEIATCIKRYDEEFGEALKSKSEVARRLNVARNEYYRFMSFFQLPALFLETLEEDNAFISRSASEAVVSTVKRLAGSEQLEQAIKDAVQALVNGEIVQTQAADFIAHAIEGGPVQSGEQEATGTLPPKQIKEGPAKVTQLVDKHEFASKAGAKFGKWARSQKKLVIQLNPKVLTTEKETALREFIAALVDD